MSPAGVPPDIPPDLSIWEMLLRFRWWFRRFRGVFLFLIQVLRSLLLCLIGIFFFLRNGWGIIGLLGCLMRSWRLGILNWWHPSDLSQI
uniref:Uncharacterized protein n=1 Tax=Helianthus annuus TaxID=4232 RepID=A0A251UQ79_HELAN